jgi:hypothetical protein
MPFFPRILVHFVGFGGRIGQGRLIEGLLGQGLQTVTELHKFGSLQVEFAGQLGSRGSLGDPQQDQHHLGRLLACLRQNRPGEGVEHSPAAATTIV